MRQSASVEEAPTSKHFHLSAISERGLGSPQIGNTRVGENRDFAGRISGTMIGDGKQQGTAVDLQVQRGRRPLH